MIDFVFMSLEVEHNSDNQWLPQMFEILLVNVKAVSS